MIYLTGYPSTVAPNDYLNEINKKKKNTQFQGHIWMYQQIL